MIRRRKVGTGALAVGVAVAAIAGGAAAAATSMDVHARLSPVAGTKKAGKFSGMLAEVGPRRITPGGRAVTPKLTPWRLTWSLTLPRLDGPMTATLRLGSARNSRVLCTRCSERAAGTITLTARQGTSMSKADAVVVVRTRSARLRGSVKVSAPVPVAKG
ncbi:MAG: hypothetical protein WAL31_10025 [Gaiellaceae bacterium]